MPFYNYKCLECEHITEIQMSWKNKESVKNIKCSKCGSEKTSHVFGKFAQIGKATVPVAPCGVPKEQVGNCGGPCGCD